MGYNVPFGLGQQLAHGVRVDAHEGVEREQALLRQPVHCVALARLCLLGF